MHFVQDGQQALDFLKQSRPDLIISDYMMPNMDGLELLNQLKNNNEYATIPVIMLTAQQAINVKLDALRIGVDDYLTKPFDNRELTIRVNTILTNQQVIKAEQELREQKVETPTMNLEDLQWLEDLEKTAIKYVYNMDFSVNQLADCIAEAFGAHIDVRDDARQLLADHYAATGRELNAARLRMARIPDGACLIDNPVSIAPGFSLENVHVMAGVPSVFQAMVASVLPTITGGAPLLSQSLRIDRGEGDIAGPLGQIATEFPSVSLGSYPFQENMAYGANIVLRGADGDQVDLAAVAVARAFGPKARDA